jgi:hypothetical protein
MDRRALITAHATKSCIQAAFSITTKTDGAKKNLKRAWQHCRREASATETT